MITPHKGLLMSYNQEEDRSGRYRWTYMLYFKELATSNEFSGIVPQLVRQLEKTLTTEFQNYLTRSKP
jgi:hypothetical protein